MIGFGCVTTSEAAFRSQAARAIERMAEPDSLLLRRHDSRAPGASCNDMLARASEHGGLEAFVLLAEDASLVDDGVLAKVKRQLTANPGAALLGMPDLGGFHEAGTLDGRVVVFSPWAIRELRFDEALDVPLDCAIADLCHQAHARDRSVVASDFGLLRHVLCKKLGDRGRLVRGAVAVHRKWATDPDPCHL